MTLKYQKELDDYKERHIKMQKDFGDNNEVLVIPSSQITPYDLIPRVNIMEYNFGGPLKEKTIEYGSLSTVKLLKKSKVDFIKGVTQISHNKM